MHLELRHLRTIRAIHEEGGLARAAERLCITQSALSHQIKALEEQAGVALFVRRSKPLKLSPAGRRLLALAEEVLPRVAEIEAEFSDLREGSAGRLHIAMECHACFDWLMPVLDLFRRAWPEVDLVISSDPEEIAGIEFVPLFDYEPRFVASAANPLAARPFIEAADFADQTLITYPMDRERLDVFSELLLPERIEPRAVRQVELTEMILLHVASNRGVAVLPDWVLREVRRDGDYITRPLTRHGLTRRLYGAIRAEDMDKPYMAHMLRLCRSEPVKLQRG